MNDARAILGVSPDATPRQIREAYRRLAFQWHPDRNPERRVEAHHRFLELAEAYAILTGTQPRLGDGDGAAGGRAGRVAEPDPGVRVWDWSKVSGQRDAAEPEGWDPLESTCRHASLSIL